MIGVNLLAEALHQHIPKGYTSFAIAFSAFVELFNLRLRKSSTSTHPIELRSGYVDNPE